MKAIRTLATLVCLCAATVITPVTAATYEGGNFKVASLRVYNQGYVFVSLSPAPTICQGGDYSGEHFRVTLDSDGGKALYSALLAAYTDDVNLSGLWFDQWNASCAVTSEFSLPSLNQIRFQKK